MYSKSLSTSLKKQTRQLTDYLGYYQGTPSFYCTSPETISEASNAIQNACQKKTTIRSRGNGHSLNGMSLPSKNEILLSSRNLNHYVFEQESSITIGAGVAIWDLNQFLKEKNYTLGVHDGTGFQAPTVGGFVSAGGIGINSEILGGFWETVLEIQFIDGQGELRKIFPADELFAWMFGSMGQLGFIVQIKIRIYKLDKLTAYPHGEKGKIDKKFVKARMRWCWFTIFSSLNKEKFVIKQLSYLDKKYAKHWDTLSIYRYMFKFISFNPPLIYPKQRSFAGNGIWIAAKKGEMFDLKKIAKLEIEIDRFTTSQSCKRYIQSEFTPKEFDFRSYFGNKIFSKLHSLKKTLDPYFIFNRGSIFHDRS